MMVVSQNVEAPLKRWLQFGLPLAAAGYGILSNFAGLQVNGDPSNAVGWATLQGILSAAGGALGGVLGNWWTKQNLEKAVPPEELFANHHLHGLVCEAIVTRINWQATQRPGDKADLDTLAKAVTKEWNEISQIGGWKRQFESLSREQLLEEMKATGINWAKQDALTATDWRNLLLPISTKHKITPDDQNSPQAKHFDNLLTLVAGDLVANYFTAVRELLKQDFESGGKTWPAAILLIQSEQLRLLNDAISHIQQVSNQTSDLQKGLKDFGPKLDDFGSTLAGSVRSLLTTHNQTFVDLAKLKEHAQRACDQWSQVQLQLTAIKATVDYIDQTTAATQTTVTATHETVGEIHRLLLERKEAVEDVRVEKSRPFGSSMLRPTNFLPPNSPPVDRSGFVDCVDAFNAYERLLQSHNKKRILLLEGEGEHGKSQLMLRFFSHAIKVLPEYSAAILTFREGSVSNVDSCFTAMCESLNLTDLKKYKRSLRIPKLFEAIALKPTILFIDGFEHTQDEHRLWLLDNFFQRIHLQTHLRIVIAGRIVPRHSAETWTGYAVHVLCDPLQYPEAFVDHASAIGSLMPADEIRQCCQIMGRQRDLRKQKGLSTDGLSPLTLITDIQSRCREGVRS